ncbi:hypothetical protein I5L01_11590 [Erythrobacter sp. YJ-T3-07]|uniref:hypothetical protein n=1 Tax=Erythrobacter sp. YJ-T3-07 TaxID=2793063 RepID=UPI0018D3D4B5|nr:hypothetical protein [Erythrobacter sp. YJ-T3-07]MBH1944873.1 hypothetical protein [Erythrobacter sp. YJ-T3-07]
MIARAGAALAALALVTPPATAGADEPVPPYIAEVCADRAGRADDHAEDIARDFEQAFHALDDRFIAFSQALAAAFEDDDQVPDAAALAELSAEMAEVYGILVRLFPMRDAGNEVWPLKFVEEDIPGGIPLPDFDPPDRQEVLRAAFVRELVSVHLPDNEATLVRFIARLEMTRSLLQPAGDIAWSEIDIGALRILATGALAEAYEEDLRTPALRVLDDGWHTSLASRLRWQVVQMCEEADR